MDEAWKGLRHFQAPACSAHQGARWELVRQLRNKLREDAWRSTSCQVYKSTRVCAHAHTHTHIHTLVLTKSQPLLGPAPRQQCSPLLPRSNPTLTNSCFRTPRPLLSLRRTCEIFCPCVPLVVGLLLSSLPRFLAGGGWGRVLRTPWLPQKSVCVG